MMTDEYHNQRLAGADAIILRAKDLAAESGVALTTCIWNNGHVIQERNNHVLEIRFRRKTVKGQFSDEQLADYPGRVGTELTEATIREMVRRLVELSKNSGQGR